MKRFHGMITKDTIESTNPLFVGDIYEDDIWEYDNAIRNPIQYIDGKDMKKVIELNGSFIFLHIDRDNMEVYIGTDQNSVYPLFYCYRDGKLYFSYNLDELFALLPCEPEVNWESVGLWLYKGPVGFDNITRFKDIKRLEAGSYLKYDGENLEVYRSDPFMYRPDYSIPYEEHLERLIYYLGAAIRRRLRPSDVATDNYIVGISGGLDSRILLSKIVNDHTLRITGYTFGEEDFIEKKIAEAVCQRLLISHMFVEIDRFSYLTHATEEPYFSGGMSLFKHTPQFHFAMMFKDSYNPYGVFLGSSLDLLIGNSYPNVGTGHDPNVRSFSEKMRTLFKDGWFATKVKEEWEDAHKVIYEKVENSLPFDRACSYHLDTRVKRWYNWNLVYYLYAGHKLLLPTYDKYFLEAVSEVPCEYREEDRIRVDMLKKINYEVSKIPYNATMQPAYLHNPHLEDFKHIQSLIEKTKLDVFKEKGIYLPSNRYDFNFLEWTRVFPEYRDFVEKFLLRNSILCEEILDCYKVKDLWNNHLEGKEDNHKELIMLVSAENMLRYYT